MLQITLSKRAAFMIALAVLLVVPALAVAQSVFDDVPDTSTHIDGITFAADSGVSVGCDTNNNYCPDDFVTRAQMATFMYRLSGNDPDTAPSVHAAEADTANSADAATNADTADNALMLDGQEPIAYTTQIDGTACADAAGCSNVAVNTETAVLALPVDVPADGIMAASYAFSGSANPSTNATLQTWLTLGDADCSFAVAPQEALPGSWQVVEFDNGTVTEASTAGQSVFEAVSGSDALYLCAVVSGDDPLVIFDGQVSSIWSGTGSGSSLTAVTAPTLDVENALTR